MKALAVISRKIPAAQVRENIESLGLELIKEYTYLDNTYLLEGDEAAMRQLTGLLALEEQEVGLTLQTLAPWHLHRIVTRSLPIRDEYDAKYTGKNVSVYIVDSGVDSTHPEFDKADVRHIWSLTGDFTDHNGHGTAMASLVNGATLGVAKSAIVRSVKITDPSRPTMMSDILDAFDAILGDASGDLVKIVNCSWTVQKSQLLDLKVIEMMDRGALVVAAAGNTGEDANLFSPGGLDRVLTVSATDQYDRMVDFSGLTSALAVTTGISNFGEEVDISAPGVDVPVATLDGKIASASGTSVSSAIVAGAAALFSEKLDSATTADEVKDALISNALSNLIFRDWKRYGDVANRMLHVDNLYYREVWHTPQGTIAKIKEDAGLVEVELDYEDDVVSITSPEFAALPPFIRLEGKKLIFDTKQAPHSAPVGYQFILECKVATGQEYSRSFNIMLYKNDVSELSDQAEEYFYELSDEGTGEYTAYVRYAATTNSFKF